VMPDYKNQYSFLSLGMVRNHCIYAATGSFSATMAVRSRTRWE